jgi:hypothetical protein
MVRLRLKSLRELRNYHVLSSSQRKKFRIRIAVSRIG